MKTLQKMFRWVGFWFLWVLLTLAGFLVDLVLFRGSSIGPSIISGLEFWIGTEGSHWRPYEILTAGILGLIDGIIIGLFQWIALRKILHKALWWVPTTAFGKAFSVMATKL